MDIITSDIEENLATLMDSPEESKEAIQTEGTSEVLADTSESTRSHAEINIELTETVVETSITSDEYSEGLQKDVEVPEVTRWSVSPKEMEIEMLKYDNDSVIYSEVLDQAENKKEKENIHKQEKENVLDSHFKIDVTLESTSDTKEKVTDLQQIPVSTQEIVEEFTQTTEHCLKNNEPPINNQVNFHKSDKTQIMPIEKDEEFHESILDLKECTELQEQDKSIESPIKTSVEISTESEDVPLNEIEMQFVTVEQKDNAQPQSEEILESLCDHPKRSNSPLEMKNELFKTIDVPIVNLDFHEDIKEIGEMKVEIESSSESPKRADSPIGMRMQFSKTKDNVSTLEVEKLDAPKEFLDVSDVPEKINSPLGMRIALSTTGDASIILSEVQDEATHIKQKETVQNTSTLSETSLAAEEELIDSEESSILHEELLEESQEDMQQAQSPVDMNISLSKCDNVSVVSMGKQEHSEQTETTHEPFKRMNSPFEIEILKNKDISVAKTEGQGTSEQFDEDDVYIESKGELETLYSSPKRTDSPMGMKIKLFSSEDVSIIPSNLMEENKETCILKDELSTSPETSKRTESPIEMIIKLVNTNEEAPTILMETLEDSTKTVDILDVSRQTESPLGMKIKLFKSDDASIVHSDISEEIEDTKQREKSESKSCVDLAHDVSKTEKNVPKLEETSTMLQLPLEESLETVPESLLKDESSADIKIEFSKIGDASIISTEKQEHLEESKSVQEMPKRTVSPLGMKIIPSKTGEESIVRSEWSDFPEEQNTDHAQPKQKEKLEVSYSSPKRIESPLGMEIKLPENSSEVLGTEISSEVASTNEPIDETMETMLEALQKLESLIDIGVKSPNMDDPYILSAETQEQSDLLYTEEISKTTEPSIEVELTESDDVSLLLPEDQDLPEEQIELQEDLETLHHIQERPDSPVKMDIIASDIEENLATLMDLPEESKDVFQTEDTSEALADISESAKSPTEMYIELTETVVETSIISDEYSDSLQKELEVSEVNRQSLSPKEMEMELLKYDNASVDYSENLDEAENRKEKENVHQQEEENIFDSRINEDIPLEITYETKEEVTKLEEMPASTQELIKESIQTAEDCLQSNEPPIDIKIKLLESDEAPVKPIEKEEEFDESKPIPEEHTEFEELIKRIEPPVEPNSEVITKSENVPTTELEMRVVTPEKKDNIQPQSKEVFGSFCDTPKRTNSPLGIKIKLFKTGDASIVPLDFHEEVKEPAETKEKIESSSESLGRTESPVGMKIKLAKTKDGASIIPMEKSDDTKENLDVLDVTKRTDSPLGMRIKLSKTGDASIIQSEVQDENKYTKQKKRVDLVQDIGSLPETSLGTEEKLIDLKESLILQEEPMVVSQEILQKAESPIGMTIKLSKYGDASIMPTEKQEHLHKMKSIQEAFERTSSQFEIIVPKSENTSVAQTDGQATSEEYDKDNICIDSNDKLETSYSSPKKADSPIGMKINLFKNEDASIVDSSLTEESKETCKLKDKLITSSEIPKRTESPIGMKIKLAKTKGGASIIPMETIEDPKENVEISDVSRRTESPLGMKIKLFKSGDASIVHSEITEEGKDMKQREKLESKGKLDFAHDALSGMKIKVSRSGEMTTVSQQSLEESIETVPESWQKVESSVGMKMKFSKIGDASVIPTEKQEHPEEIKFVQEVPKRTESPLGMKIRLSKTGDASIIQSEWSDYPEEHNKDHIQSRPKERLEVSYGSPKRTGSPLGMKIKLSRSGDASIVSSDLPEENKPVNKLKDKLELSPEIARRTESPIGMKIKLARTKSGAAIISMENPEDAKEKLEVSDIPKRTESPLGMKIKLFKSGDASIVHSEITEEAKDTKQKERTENKEKVDVGQDVRKSLETLSGVKIKTIKSGEPHVALQKSVDQSTDTKSESWQKVESPIGMKIKLSKFGDASIISTEQEEQQEEAKSIQEVPRRTESPLGMKIKLSKSGDASIIQSEAMEDGNKLMRTTDIEHSKNTDTALGIKIKLLKTGDASIIDSEKKERQQRRPDTESPLEMKIKLSKTGHPTIVAYDSQAEAIYKSKEALDSSQSFTPRYKESGQSILYKESALKILKSGHSAILQSNRSELTIEPVQMQGKKLDNMIDISSKRKDIYIAPVESKKAKLEAQLTQILPEVTIQPVASRDQKQFVFDPKTSAISLQQMNVISQEISITQVRPSKLPDASMSEKLKDILSKSVSGSPMNSDCEIIEHRPELIIVNESSNSSQDVVIIEEVSPSRMPEVKVPKKRGRPRRNPLPQGITHPPPHLLIPRDPLSLDDMQHMRQSQIPHFESRENERPKRTCRSQKSYAPPRRGRGRGRGKRKLDNFDPQIPKKLRIDQDLTKIEASTTAVITIDDSMTQQASFEKSSELYKALQQPALDSTIISPSEMEKKVVGPKGDSIKSSPLLTDSTLSGSTIVSSEINKDPEVELKSLETMPASLLNDSKDDLKNKNLTGIVPEKIQTFASKSNVQDKSDKAADSTKLEGKDMLVPPGHSNWLTPMSKRTSENTTKHENVSMVQVIDEETRMSAESGSRSQTPARNISLPASETVINEESQGSVLSTATTESEKVKVKNRRMEINFDPDEGPFTVDKIAEYEWPLDRKGETFMIQEQISQYLGVKSFKRKYPDLKRRVVDMEERNYLRENGLVSEAMCDMGLTAICSSEVLDVMCSDFPDQYEEYRKHMREKQVKEHSKKQKELTAAANAEKNRIDLAEMAVQSALSWNISLNKARREDRKCSLDLQTFTIHVPKKQQKVEERKVGYYPVALIPGQYTDYYREYTPAELRYYPLNTVLYGPTKPNERKFDSQSEGSQSDNDSDSSSDDSSSSSSEGTQNTEGSQSTMDEVDIEIASQKEEMKLKCKMCLKALNKHSKNEVLIQCGTCNGHVHPSCIDLTLDMVPHIRSYAWQCTDCKTCAQCHDPADEDKMLFCDMCDRGYHIYCVGLRRVPQGRWHCQECAVCANCASREPGGINSDRNSVAQWQHEYKKGDKNTRVYVSTLCVPCSKLWRKGRYCPHCSRCHTAPRLDLEANLVHCSACDKYLHLDCVETKGVVLDRKNYLCDFCAPTRQYIIKPLISKPLRT